MPRVGLAAQKHFERDHWDTLNPTDHDREVVYTLHILELIMNVRHDADHMYVTLLDMGVGTFHDSQILPPPPYSSGW
jgi:hypothetical protein